jgi:hypothetical protein
MTGKLPDSLADQKKGQFRAVRQNIKNPKKTMMMMTTTTMTINGYYK